MFIVDQCIKDVYTCIYKRFFREKEYADIKIKDFFQVEGEFGSYLPCPPPPTIKWFFYCCKNFPRDLSKKRIINYISFMNNFAYSWQSLSNGSGHYYHLIYPFFHLFFLYINHDHIIVLMYMTTLPKGTWLMRKHISGWVGRCPAFLYGIHNPDSSSRFSL